MKDLRIRIEDDHVGVKFTDLMADKDWSGQKVAMYIFREYFSKKTVQTKDIAVPPKKPSSKFSKPSIEEVEQCFFSKGSNTCQDDAETFYNHYESNGWKVGKNSMKNWKATVAQWHKRNQEGNNHGKNKPAAVSGLDLDSIDY